MKNFFYISLFLFIGFIHSPVGADSTIESKMIEKMIATDPVAKDFQFISQTIQTDFIKNHIVYEFTTFDLLPLPAWHFAVKKDKIFMLDRRNLPEWNDVIAAETITLSKNEDVVRYVKFFLAMTMNQSQFIDKLLPLEISRIEAKDKKKPDEQIKITRTVDKIQVIFYARDAQGDLQQWNLILKNNGEILKLQERSY